MGCGTLGVWAYSLPAVHQAAEFAQTTVCPVEQLVFLHSQAQLPSQLPEPQTLPSEPATLPPAFQLAPQQRLAPPESCSKSESGADTQPQTGAGLCKWNQLQLSCCSVDLAMQMFQPAGRYAITETKICYLIYMMTKGPAAS